MILEFNCHYSPSFKQALLKMCQSEIVGSRSNDYDGASKVVRLHWTELKQENNVGYPSIMKAVFHV